MTTLGLRCFDAKLKFRPPELCNYQISQLLNLNHPITNRSITNPKSAAAHVDKKFTALFVIHPRRSNSAPRKLSQIMPTNPHSAMMYASESLTVEIPTSAVNEAAK